MDVRQIKLRKSRDFFGFRAPREAFDGLLGVPWHRLASDPAMILDLQRREQDVRALRVDDAPIGVVSFPFAHRALIAILTRPACQAPHDSLEVLLPRRTFDQLADGQGASRIKRLDLEAGIAADDPLMRHLAASLAHALDGADAATATAVDQITAAATVRIAQRYGGLQPARAPQRGGLATWQLRLVLASFDRHLDGSVSLQALAHETGLSVNHFTRAFQRSTGLAPHRWLMRRRVELAKDLMLAEPLPLAQVAVACGFADQSHFTRTFASLIGLTPARWRSDQERESAHANEIGSQLPTASLQHA
jgi:AraC-like DNA-binding protein